MTRALDLFSGAGGATQGLKGAGVEVVAAVEMDSAAAATYALNHPEVRLYRRDVREVDPSELLTDLNLDVGEVDILKSCPPCQPFSTLGQGGDPSDGNSLVTHLLAWVRRLKPTMFIMENVPGITRSSGLVELQKRLRTAGYSLDSRIVRMEDFEIPQTRKRWIGLAQTTDTRVDLEKVLEPLPRGDASRTNAAATLEKLPVASATNSDPLHRPRSSSDMTLQRIRAIPPGGNRFDLPEELELDCHRSLQHRHATSPYGRIPLEGPGPTMTTRCTTPSCGRFVHPTLDRPITLREAATLQTFPSDYRFSGNYGEIERQIGNAVPVSFVTTIVGRILNELRVE